MYTITFRRDCNLIDIRWRQLFDAAGVEAYATELERRFREERFAAGYRLRMDMSGCSVQPVEAAAAINRRLAGFPLASRIAIVTASAVTRLQVRRLMTQSYLRIFDSADAAFDWLVADDGTAAAA